MKKSLFAICSLLLIAFSSSAQITLTASNSSTIIPPPGGVDSLAIVDLANSTIPTFGATTNTMWSLATATYNDTDRTIYYQGQNQFQYADSINYQFDSIHYQAKGFCYYVVQENALAAVIKDSTAQLVKTGNSRIDTLFYPYEESFLTYLYQKQIYPETYQATWNNNYSVTQHINLSDTALFTHTANTVTHGSIVHISFANETNDVIGWGKMAVKSFATDSVTHQTKLDTLDVLEVQRTFTQLDSIAMPKPTKLGSDANANLYDSLNVKSHYYDTVYERAFYSEGAITPLVRVTYTDATFGTVKRIAVRESYLTKATTGVNSVIANNDKVTVYPNPITNGNFTVDISGAGSSKWTYDIINMTGQVVSRGNLAISATQTRAQVQTPSLPSGTYMLRISNDDMLYSLKELQVMNR